MDIPEISLSTTHTCCDSKKALSALPVHIYNNGEYVCGRCPLNVFLEARRNTAYEELAELFLFPCSYKEAGCKEKCRPSDMLQHELYCPYKRQNCPYFPECKWLDNFDKLYDHYCREHNGSKLEMDREQELNLQLKSFESNYILRYNTSDLLVQIRKIDDDLYLQTSSINFKSTEVFYSYVDINFSATMDNLHITIPEAKIQIYRQTKLLISEAYHVELGKLLSKVSSTLFTIHISKRKQPIIPILKSCSSCESVMMPPIYQCDQGDILCCLCIEQFEKCPSCLIPLRIIRIKALEECMDNIEMVCRFCSDTFLGSQMSDHISECPKKPRKCPFEDCGKFDVLINHIRNEHKDRLHNANSKVYRSFDLYNTSLLMENVICDVLQKENILFFFNLEESHDDIYISCKLLQPTAKTFHYSFAFCTDYDRLKLTKKVSNYAETELFQQLCKSFIEHYKKNGVFKYSIDIKEYRTFNNNNYYISDNENDYYALGGLFDNSC